MHPSEYTLMQNVEDHFWWYGGLRHLIQLSIRRFCEPGPIRILDAGCGTGANLAWINAQLPQSIAVGMDYSPLAAKLASKRQLKRLTLGDIHRMPFDSNCFQVCVCCDVLGQRGVEWNPALSEIKRVLAPQGVIFLNLPAFSWLKGDHDLAAHVQRRFHPEEVRARLTEAGFTVELLTCWNFAFLPILWARRTMQRKNPSSVDGQSDLSELPDWVNRILGAWIRAENSLAFHLRFPVGSSIFAVARKK